MEPGYILGLQTTSGDAVLGRVSVGSDKPDKVDATTFSVGATFDAALLSDLTERHAIRAIASGGSRVSGSKLIGHTSLYQWHQIYACMCVCVFVASSPLSTQVKSKLLTTRMFLRALSPLWQP